MTKKNGTENAVDVLCEAARRLHRHGLLCDVDLYVEAGASELLHNDGMWISTFLAPTRAPMPDRPGFVPIGCIRVDGRLVRVYEKLV